MSNDGLQTSPGHIVEAVELPHIQVRGSEITQGKIVDPGADSIVVDEKNLQTVAVPAKN